MNLQIPTPCSQSWDSMDARPGGRFCSACQKTVVDFTALSDAEVLRYFRERPGQALCGRLRPGQLNRDLLPPPRVVSPWRLRALTLLGLGSGLWAAAYSQPRVSTPPRPAEQLETAASQPLRKRPARPRPRKTLPMLTLLGRVRTQYEAVPGCTVSLDSGRYQTQTDSMGIFRLRVPAFRAKTGRLRVQKEGFVSREGRLSGTRLGDIRIRLERVPEVAAERDHRLQPGVLSGVVVTRLVTYETPSRLRRFWYRVKWLFARRKKADGAEPE